MATAKPSLLHTAISAILEYAGSFDLLHDPQGCTVITL